MYHLALVLPLSIALSMQPAPSQAPPGTVAAPQDPCAQARRIVDQRPCVRPEDCGAFQEWKETFGAPGLEPLKPEIAGGGAVPAQGRTGATVYVQRRRQAPPVFNCAAAKAAEPETPGSPDGP